MTLVEGEEPRAYPGLGGYPTWSPDSKLLVIDAPEGGGFALMDRSGEIVGQVLASTLDGTGEIGVPSWQRLPG